MTTTNRQITKAILGPDCADSGCPVRVYLSLSGTPELEPWHLDATKEALARLFIVTGATEWSEIVGRYVRTRRNDVWTQLGHITRDIWIDNRGRDVGPAELDRAEAQEERESR